MKGKKKMLKKSTDMRQMSENGLSYSIIAVYQYYSFNEKR